MDLKKRGIKMIEAEVKLTVAELTEIKEKLWKTGLKEKAII